MVQNYCGILLSNKLLEISNKILYILYFPKYLHKTTENIKGTKLHCSKVVRTYRLNDNYKNGYNTSNNATNTTCPDT